uniref:Transmembrane protein 144 homolog (inferred by orthology to a C. elegans protein) n=1 Tax=Strongyloides venezuelensis TaxID=75913 RepID=A0A0K0F820_STRVS
MSTVLGLLACAISSLLFGSMFVPIKKYNPGDGVFVQWVMGLTIMFIGVVMNFINNFPPFEPLAMIGGFFWAVGNLTAIPIINMIGVGLGMLVWGTVNCTVGWACGRFGLFDTIPSVPKSPIINYIGLIFVIMGGILFSRVKSSTIQRSDSQESFGPVDEVDEESSILNRENNVNGTEVINIDSTKYKKEIAIFLSICAGLCYGLTFLPVVYIQSHPKKYPEAPKDAIAFAFSHYTGIFVTTTVFMVIYCIYKKNKPEINNEIILPAIITGIIWSIAQLSWFVANDALSQAITFPIISMVPGICAALWGVFYFREITGKDNLKLLALAIGITSFGAILVGISKDF